MRINHKHFVYIISLPELAWKKCKQTGLLLINSGFGPKVLPYLCQCQYFFKNLSTFPFNAGKPHANAVKEDDIELVTDSKLKFDDSGNFRSVKTKQKLEEKSIDELEEEERKAKIAKTD